MRFPSRIVPLLPVLACLSFPGCSRKPAKTAHRWFGMDTDFSATLYSGAGRVPADSAFALLERESVRLERVFSDFLPGSSLSRLIGRAGDTLATGPEIMDVFRAAAEMAEASRGSFDITLHNLKTAWGLSSGDSGRVPAPAELIAALHGNPAFGAPPDSNPAAYPPYRLLEGKDGGAPNRMVLLRDSAVFDLGGIAKGYAVDRMHALLNSLGYPDHIVTAGGDLRVGGHKGPGPWTLGIRHPRHADALAGTLTLAEPLAVSTSGDYERYFIRDGVRYHHIFDPRTGKPARPYCSVTVLSPGSLLSDRLTKPLFILGPGRGDYLLKRFGARAVWMRESAAGTAGDRIDAGGGEPSLCYVASEGLAGILAIKDIPPCASGGQP
jgi:thiamine biosynthesis lipoprotein